MELEEVFIDQEDFSRGCVMGTIVFIILRFGFGINNYGDGQALAMLVSLDTIALLLFLQFRKGK